VTIEHINTEDVQRITLPDGTTSHVVVPIELWNQIVDEQGEEKVYIPGEVVEILIDKDVSMLAAWRIHRGLNQEQMAEKLGCTQGAVAQAEEKGKRTRRSTLEEWADILDCEWEQLKEV